jgi:hypothetical protein
MSSILDEMLAEAEGKLMEYEYVGQREPVTTSTSDTAPVTVNLPVFVIHFSDIRFSLFNARVIRGY